jgi:hypothetical protein
MNRGYIKLWRKVGDSKLYRHHKAWTVWTYLLLNATHQEYDLCTGREIVHLKPGQIVIGRNKLAKELAMSPQNIRTCLQLLKNDQKITIKPTNRFSLVTIVNWGFYQGDNPKPTNRLTSDQPATNQQPTTEQEHKNKEHRAGAPKKKATAAPAEFPITDKMQAFATKHGINGNIQTITDHFLDFHRAKGSTFKDWTAAWRTWVRNEVKFGGSGKQDDGFSKWGIV